MEVQKGIEQNPHCGRLYEGRAKFKNGIIDEKEGKQRTWEDWESLSADPPTEGYFHGDYVEESHKEPAWSIEEYKSMKEKGQDSYIVYQPVIRRTTIHLTKPEDVGDASGKRQDPPGAAGFARKSDFEWLGGPDRCTKGKRTYTRCTEWQGAEHWEPLTYPT